MSKHKSAGLQLAMKQKQQKHATAHPAATTPLTPAGVAKLQERAMLCRLATGRWYGRGSDEGVVTSVRERAEAKGDIGTFQKRLMERQHLAAIDAVVNDARRYHKAMTLPWFDQMRILSAELFLDYKSTMSDYEMKFEKEVRVFLTRFDDLKKAEKQRLGKLYREEDYPTHEGLKQRFYFRVRFEPVPDANDFRVRLGGDDMEAVKHQIEEQVTAAVREATIELWRRLYELVKKLRDVLASSDGSVRASLFGNLKEIVAVMPKLNLTGDKKLEALTARVAKELLSEDVEAVKDSEAVRSAVASKASNILDAMSSFLGSDTPQDGDSEAS